MKKIFKSNNLGISLMECMIVIIIIGVMLLIWRFTSKGHMRIAMVNEGQSLVEKVVAQERVYRANRSDFIYFTATDNQNDLKINAHDNKYFLTFSADKSAGSGKLRVVTYGSGKASGMQIIGIYTASTNKLEIKEVGL